MHSTTRFLRLVLGALLMGSAPACAGVLSSGGAEYDPGAEPPRSWPSAIQFVFQDPAVDPGVSHSTRASFHDGARVREVTHRDMVPVRTYERVTPWIRLGVPDDGRLAVRVTLEDASGARTEAEYPISVHRDLFYTVYATVGTRDPQAHPFVGMPGDVRGYPLVPAMGARASDSLWISYSVRSRDCFACPT